MPNNNPIDPLQGPKMALRGRVACMDAANTLIDDGLIFIEKGGIVAVQPANAPKPAAFQAVPVIESGGTILPGLIELHNHLSYNALPLWKVPKKYENRDTWAGTPEYHKLISGPMKVVGQTPDLMPAVVRYVEMKCLLGGVTTSQGIELFSNAGARRFYRGLVRNVEQTDEAALPEASTKIGDVDNDDVEKFYQRLLKQKSCLLLHLSEGTNQAALDHFLALQRADGSWAVTKALAGIHCAALKPEHFDILGAHHGAMVWSPLSNLLLYGKTANVTAARGAGVRISLGSDWSPSGSKNLLGELKVARLVNQHLNLGFTDRDIVRMATTTPASILQWDKSLGSIEAGKRADFVVINGTAGDAYAKLIEAKETDIALVMINGVPRYGKPSLLEKFEIQMEAVSVGGKARAVFLGQKTADPAVGLITLAAARKTLKEALHNLPDLARKLEQPSPPSPIALTAHPYEVRWFLALDEIEETGVDVRPHLPLGKQRRTGPRRVPVSAEEPLMLAAAAKPLSQILEPIVLDPLTVADDVSFLPTMAKQMNLPAFLAPGLAQLY